MNVLLIGPVYPYRGGIAQYTAHLAQALAEAGHTAQILSFKQQYPAWLYPGKSDREPDQQPRPANASYQLHPLYPWTWPQAAQQATRLQPDRIIIQWWTTFWAPAYASLAGRLRRSGFAPTYLIHNTLPHEPRPWDAPLARLALRQGCAFIVQSPREQARLETFLNPIRPPRAAQPKVFLCHLPSYDRFAETPVSQAEARCQLGLPPANPLLLCFGLVRPYKGLHDLLDALAQLRDRQPAIHLLVAGEFWSDKRSYLDQIAALGLTGQVHILDRYLSRAEAHLAFSACDILTAAYRDGTQSAVAPLALAYGRPLIATTPIAAGLETPWPGQLLVTPPADPAALAGAIREMLARPAQPAPPPNTLESGWQPVLDIIAALPGRGEAGR
jgi:glycosyltransferase involved in cell wall biosynthesis